MKENKSELLILKGQAYWSKLRKPDENGKFTMDLTVDKETKSKLKSLGIRIKNKDKDNEEWNQENPDRQRPLLGDFVSLNSRFAPIVVDSKKDLIPAETQIGNGSEVNVIAAPYTWKSPTGKEGTSLGLRKVQVTNLVEYKAKSTQSLDFDTLDSDSSDSTPF